MNCAALATGSANIEMSSDMSRNISYLGTQPNKQLLGTVWECCTSRCSRLWTNSERRSTPSPVKSQTHWPSWRITSNYSVLICIPSKVEAALPLHLASSFVLSRACTTTWGQSLFSWQNTPALPDSNHVWWCSRQSMTVEFQHVVPHATYPETSGDIRRHPMWVQLAGNTAAPKTIKNSVFTHELSVHGRLELHCLRKWSWIIAWVAAWI